MLNCSVSAENLKLIQESELSLDALNLTASTHPRKDSKGNDCGLIIVESLVDSLSFEGAVGNVIHNNAQYLVYVPKNTKSLKIRKGNASLKIKFGAIESKQVFRTRIASSIDFGKVSIESTPVGADIYVDGKFVGNTPLKDYRISPGEHDVTISQKGYIAYKRCINVKPRGNVKVKSRLDIEPNYKSLYKQFR